MRRWTVSAVVLALVAMAAPAAARFGFPDAVTERAKMIEDVYVQIFIVGTIVFLFVMALLAYIMVRFREHGGAGRNTFEKERDNLRAEMTWTIIPLIIVLWVGVISYQALVDLDDIDESAAAPDIIIDITGEQYAWTAVYDNGIREIASANANMSLIDPFYLPEDTSVLFRVTGKDVVHSFNVVGLGQTLDAVPGQTNELLVQEGLPAGDYFTQCKENCLTPGHSYMRAMLKVVPQAEYDEWVEFIRSGGGAGADLHIPVFLEAGGFSAPRGVTMAVGWNVLVQVANNDSVAHTFTLGNQTLELGPGGFDAIEITPETLDDLVLRDDAGRSVTLTVEESQTLDVELDDFAIRPMDMELEAGGFYDIEVANIGGVTHNLFIGLDGGDGVREAIWSTEDFPGGESMTLRIHPEQPMTLEMWCAITGHYSAGMFGSVTVI